MRSGSGWFRLHMVLGIIGPALIVMHCNFRLGSLNSNVALFAMLTVVASGIIGRYIYARIHRGLYGRKADVREFLVDAERWKQLLGAESGHWRAIADELTQFEQRVLQRRRGFMALSLYGMRERRARARTLSFCRETISALDAGDAVSLQLYGLLGAATLNVAELNIEQID